VGAMVGALGLVWLMLRGGETHPGRRQARLRLFGRYLRLALPIVLTGLIIQVSIIAEKTAATGFAAGSVASLAFARRIAFLAIALGAQPITVVFFPELASTFARGQAGAFRRHLRTAIVVTALALIPGASILGGFAQPITQLLLERGMFRAEDNRARGRFAEGVRRRSADLCCELNHGVRSPRAAPGLGSVDSRPDNL